MSMFRSLPPVIGPIESRALWHALTALDDGEVFTAATAAIEARYPGRQVHLTCSGTVALETAIRESRRVMQRSGAGLIALPAWCCPDVATAAIGAGARIVLYDLDPRTLHPDMSSLERALQRGADSVVVVHYFGRITDWEPCTELARRYGATVIEDAAQGAGAGGSAAPVGANTGWGVLSFGRGKGRHAGGGGALLSEVPVGEATHGAMGTSADLKVLVRALAVTLLARPSLFALARALPLGIGETHYMPPATVRHLSHVVASLIPAALEREHADAEGRREAAGVWRGMLADKSFALLSPVPPGQRDGALRFPVLADAAHLQNVQHLGVAKGYPITLDAYAEIVPHLEPPTGSCHGGRELAARLHTLPNHHHVRQHDRLHIVDAIRP